MTLHEKFAAYDNITHNLNLNETSSCWMGPSNAHFNLVSIFRLEVSMYFVKARFFLFNEDIILVSAKNIFSPLHCPNNTSGKNVQ
jgi:hypothetical protein